MSYILFAIVFGAAMIIDGTINLFSKDSKTITISKDMFEHYKKSWYEEGYADGKYNRTKQL